MLPEIPEVEVSNETDSPIQAEGVIAVVVAVLAAERVRGAVDVAFLQESSMAELNSRYRGLQEATDVLSFPGGAEDEWPEPAGAEAVSFLGDVLICPAVAARYATADGIGLGEELTRLLVHGTLHLLGYDHEVDEGEMRTREDEVLVALARSMPVLLAGS